MTEITKMDQDECGVQIDGPNWTVDVVPSGADTGRWYARSKEKGDKRYEVVTCDNRDLAAERAVQFVYENIWENL
jgi:hypothetical protein